MKNLLFILSIIFLFTSCKKEVNSNGYDLLNSEDAFVGAIDTFTINSSTKVSDSIITSNPSYLFIGQMKDPVFGKVTAGFCSQLRLISLSPNFGDINSIEVDSVVLSINYIDKYGLDAPLIFDVYRITDDLKDQTYYSDSKISDDGFNLHLNKSEILPRVAGSYFIDKYGDTIYDQITLKLDPKLGQELIQQSINSPTTYTSIDNFNSWFKGLKVKAYSDVLSDSHGALYYIANAPRLTIHYKVNGVNKKYYFELNKNGIRLNNIDFYRQGYEVESSIDKLNFKSFYSQSNQLRSTISIPSLTNISKNSVIHSAKLVLPYDYNNNLKYNPGYQISISVPNSESDDRLRVVGYGEIDTTNHVFIVDVRDHIQSIITGKRLNLGLYISPKEFSTTSTRIKFLNEGEYTPKLYLKVSSFKQ